MSALVLLFLVFVLGIGLFSMSLKPETEELSVSEPPAPFQPAEATYSLEMIPDIELIYRVIEHRPLPEHLSETALLHSAILPHHTLLAEELADFWWEIKELHAQPDIIVLLGPTHEDQGQNPLQTTDGVWNTPFGEVHTGSILITQEPQSVLETEPDSFTNEHSIGAQIPFIAHLYPEVPVIPVLVKQSARLNEMQALVQELEALDQDILFVSSIDFSHYLSEKETAFHDEVLQGLIEKEDLAIIEGLNADYVDSPASLIGYLLWVQKKECRNTQRWHESNYSLFDIKNDEGTSYFVYFCLTELPVRLSVAGDVMLGRAVESWFSKTTMEDAYKDAKEAFSDSEMGFVNLESVLTEVEPSTGKEIHFKGSSDRTDVLQFVGVTHVSVANNHVDDYGKSGWTDSVQNVKDADIEPVGGYRNDGAIVYTQREGKTFAFVAYDDTIFRVDESVLAEQVAEAAEHSDVVVVSFHWGGEYGHEASRRQVALAHHAIDAGADLVLGTHPHVLQGIEMYGSGLILYSLGNFVFDQEGFDQNETMVARIEWLGERKQLEMIPMRIVGGFPRMADEQQKKETLSRLAGWSDAALREQIETGELFW